MEAKKVTEKVTGTVFGESAAKDAGHPRPPFRGGLGLRLEGNRYPSAIGETAVTARRNRGHLLPLLLRVTGVTSVTSLPCYLVTFWRATA